LPTGPVERYEPVGEAMDRVNFDPIASLAKKVTSGIEAIDGAASRASMWSKDGAWTRDIAIQGLFVGDAWETDSALIVRTHTEQRGSALLKRIDGTSAVQPSIRILRFSGTGAGQLCRYCKMAVVRDLSIVSHTLGDSLYLLARISAGGERLRPISRTGLHPAEKLQVELDSTASFRRQAVAQRPTREQRDAVAAAFAAMPISRTKALLLGTIVIDRDGSSWVKRQTRRGSAAEMDEFDKSAQLLFVVRLPDGRRLLRVRDADLLATYSDENGRHFIEEYSVNKSLVGKTRPVPGSTE